MNRHADTELLSAYLDDEVALAEARSLEAHLAVCESCRVQLEGMRRTIHRLGTIERPAPPPWLAQRVHHHVVEAAAHPSLWQQLRRTVLDFSLPTRLSSALSVALTLPVLVFLLAHGVGEQERVTLLEAGAVQPAPAPPRRPATIITVTEEDILVTTSEVAGRTFMREEDGEIWVQAGLVGREPEARVITTSPEGRALLARYEGLRDLIADGSRVMLLDDHREALELWSGT
jgi:Putative zinc-finger